MIAQIQAQIQDWISRDILELTDTGSSVLISEVQGPSVLTSEVQAITPSSESRLHICIDPSLQRICSVALVVGTVFS